MRIGHISPTPIAGIPALLSNLINKYSNHESICLSDSNGDYPDGRQFDTPTHFGIESNADKLEDCDVIHIHNMYPIGYESKLDKIVKNKPVVIQYHSPYLSEPRKVTNKKQAWCCLAQRYILEYPKAIPVPNIVSVSQYKYVSINEEKYLNPDNLKVFWSPSTTDKYHLQDNSTDNHAKGYAESITLLENLHGVNFQLIMGMPINDLMVKKAEAHIGIDDVVTGGYHKNTLEYMLLGVPVICKLLPAVENWLTAWADGERPPIINIQDYNQLPRVISYYNNNRDKLYSLAKDSKDWMLYHWRESKILAPYFKLYREVLDDKSI
jgi:hypothetical protein